MEKVLIWIFSLVTGICLLVWVYGVPSPPQKLTRADLIERIRALNESTAWHVPHFGLDDGVIRTQYEALFAPMEQGQVLSTSDSRRYREIYQQLLRENRSGLAFFDRNLTVLVDHAMDIDNNVGSTGIAGDHDHHDASIRSNLNDIQANLEILSGSSFFGFSPAKILAGLLVHKDTMDILLHVGTVPQTKSTRYEPLQTDDPVADATEKVLQHFKNAQFEGVNSFAYWQDVDRGIVAYAELVIIVQDLVFARLTPAELVVVGAWGNWRTFAPGPEYRPIRNRP